MTAPLPTATTARPAAAGQTVARVMVCDDSVVIRGALTRMLEAEPDIRVVARAPNGRAALDEVARQTIDVIVLDIEMPEMDGLTALPLLLKADPELRIVMASTLTTRGAQVAMQALKLGAADYVPKPSVAAIGDDSFRRELVAKVKGLARQRQRGGARAVSAATGHVAAAPLRAAPIQVPHLLAVGSSTGGPQALFTLIQGLGGPLPVPVVITQHMPATFTPILAEHIARLGIMPCAEQRDGAPLQAGHIYLAPGDRHLLVDQRGGGLIGRLSDGNPENFCRPAVDPMLRSAATACGGRVLVVMLTGMGQDGMLGTRSVVEAGGTALAQDEATSVVWGMPGAVAQAGLCHQVLALPMIARRVREIFRMSRA